MYIWKPWLDSKLRDQKITLDTSWFLNIALDIHLGEKSMYKSV